MEKINYIKILKEIVKEEIGKENRIRGFLSNSSEISHYFIGIAFGLRVGNKITLKQFNDFSNWVDKLTLEPFNYTNFWGKKKIKRGFFKWKEL